MEVTTQDSASSDWLVRMQSWSRLRLGVSFRNLSVYGFTSSTRFQPTVVSYALALPRLIASLLSRRADTKVQILQDFDGLVRHGEMLLVLGRPGSGCTTFLKALAGDTHGIVIDRQSKINYEGIPYEQLHSTFKGESIYLAELDVHFPELTLGQTITFAACTRETGLDRGSASRKVSRDVAVLLGLESAFNTCMGNAMIRGVSGGEKRRTSMAEALIGGSQLQCWDNSTRGLDSSTALKFVELLRESTNDLETTVIMSIYQASESIYEKFDKVSILYEGRQIYFGPTRFAARYFYELGFLKPARATTPDFLTSLTNPAERVVREGYEDRAPRSPDEFATAWKKSLHAGELLSDIEQFNENYPILVDENNRPKGTSEWKDKLSLRSSTYVIPIYLQIYSCLQRGAQRLLNQPAPVIGSVFANAILALVVGSVYYNLPDTSDSMDKRAVLIFFSLLLTAFSPAFEVLTIWAQRPIVEKHDRYAFYHPFTDAAASMICDLPNKFATALLFQIVIYFMTNLRRTPAAFFTWFLFNFVLVLNMSMWFRLVGTVSRTVEQSTAPTCILVLLSCIYGGFVVPVPYMVSWLKWFRYVNPIAYTYESLMINEFQDHEFRCSQLIPGGPSYTEIGLDNKICSVVGAISGQDYVQGSRYLAEKYTYVSSHLWRNLAIITSMTIIVCAFHLLAAECIPVERSKGDILQFRRTNRWRNKPGDSEARRPVGFTQDVNKQEDYNQSEEPKPQSSVQEILKQSSVFHWNNLCYDVKTGGNGTRRLLDNIDGWVKPGTLTALMGVTGAGKTTLLNVLANRASFGIPSGDVCIDGQERDAGFQRKIGYAQQDDIHLSTATVREALEFSALLRQSNASVKERLGYVDTVIQILGMESYADAIVGVPGNGLNIQQRKQLTIGVELVAKPELLLFLDEPTSGQDSQTAWSICTLLRKLADNGQAVLCTIHQPSSQLFLMFDSLLLLNKQGQTVYFGDIGPNATTLISYFEKNGAEKCDTDANPAEWILNMSATSTKKAADTLSSDYWAQKWSSSQQKADVLRYITELKAQSQTALPRTHQQEYATSWFQQMMVVPKRTFQEYWRSPVYLYSKLALCAGVALFNGLSFQNTRYDVQGLQNLIFSMFLLTQIFGTMDQQVIPRLIDGRALFEAREHQSKSYSWTVFLAANILAEVAWQTLAAVLIFVAWYYPTGLWRNGDAAFGTAERGALSFVIILLYCLWISTFSQAVAAGIEHAETAIQLATLMFWFSLVFCGVMVAPNDLPGFWKFVWHASPLTYLIDGLASAGLADVDVFCSPVQLLTITPPNGTTCGDYLAPYVQQAGGSVLNPADYTGCQFCQISDTDSFLYGHLDIGSGSPWKNAGYFAVFVVFNILATFALYWLARVPRKREVFSSKAGALSLT
ncbi:ABC-2 type transporter-domain-containing protein [Biscogniauxia marginata]|nr:ABC-2 type transporter-domain-containing protein [Biscogniauxia marginata]